MLMELLCPKCRGQLEMDEDLKTGTCPYCGTKVVLTESIPQKLDVQLPEVDSPRSLQLTQYSYRMFIQGDKKAALDSVDEALRLDSDNTEAWVLYSVLTKKQLKPEIKSSLDLEKGEKMAKDILAFDGSTSQLIFSMYPELEPQPDVPLGGIIKWDEIQRDSYLDISIEYKCSKRKDFLVHYYNWSADSLTLEQGKNTLKLESGIHVFVNTKTKNYLIIAIPQISKGIPLYFSSTAGSSICSKKGANRFTRWYSDQDTTIVNAYIIDESTGEKAEVDCNGMWQKVSQLL